MVSKNLVEGLKPLLPNLNHKGAIMATFTYNPKLGTSFEDQLWDHMNTIQLTSIYITSWSFYAFSLEVTAAAMAAGLNKNPTVILNTWIAAYKARWFTSTSFTLT